MEYPFKDLLPLDEVLAREGYYKDWTHLDPEVFYSLTQISEYIKTKGYGVDVRLLIAQLAEHFGLKTTQVVDLANLLQQKFTNLEGVTQSFTNNINSLVAQMEADKDAVIANATVDSEVILARGGKATLGQRLDETTAQLEQTGVNLTQNNLNLMYLNSKIGELGASSTFKGSDSNANILAKSTKEIGDEWYDTTNNQSLRWNGESWLPVGGTVKLGDKSVKPRNISGFDILVGENKFNKNTVTIGSYIANNTGIIATGVPDYALSDRMPLKPSTQYIKTETLFIAFFKNDGSPSDITKGVSGQIFTTPSDAAYGRATFRTVNLNSSMLVEGDKLPDNYVTYVERVVLDPTIFDIKPTNTKIKRSRNLFDKSKVSWGGWYNGDGEFVNFQSYGLSEPIPVKEGEVIVKKTNGHSTWLDADLNFVSTWHSTSVTRVPKGVSFVRAVTNRDNVDTEMVVKGYEYPSEYIPFHETVFDDTVQAIDPDTLIALTSRLYGKKWAFLGDSISEYLYSYPHFIAPKHRMETVHMALSGRSMASRGEPTDTLYPPLVNIYTDVPSDTDIITIMIGTNDKGSSVPIGSIDSQDKTTYLGAYNEMISWLVDNRPFAKILLITPMQRADSIGIGGSPSLLDYVNAVKEIGRKYSLPVLDLYSGSGMYVHSSIVQQNFIPDKLHPNADGHKLFLAPVIEAEMLRL